MKKTLLIFLTLVALTTNAQVTASFSLAPSVGCSSPHTVFFTDLSTNPDTWLWEFGDGNTSTAQNPIHSYTGNGTFIVSLMISDTVVGTTDIVYDTVKVGVPNADIGGPSFGYFGCAPLSANFVDASTSTFAISSWSWTFGDGGTSTLQNPTYTYQTRGVYNVSLTITDINGCSSTITKTNFVQAIGPDVNFGADQTQICPNTTVNFTDSTSNGSPIISRVWDFGDGSPTSNLQHPTHTYVNSGLYSVSLIVSDLDGCSRTYTINDYIDVGDIIPPTITCPAPITLNTDAGQCTSTGAIGTATGTDNCGTPTITNDAPSSFPIGITTVTWASTDASANFVTCTQEVTVVDNEPPTINCPAPITLNTDVGQCTSTGSIGATTGTDNCGVPTITNDAPTSFPIGTTTVTWTSTDASANFVTCTQEVTVVDNEPPTITCPAPITLSTDAGQCTSTGAIGTATGTDNCGTPTITNDAPSSFPIGITTVTWTSTDASANFVTCTQEVTVVDNESPTINCPAPITLSTDAGQCTSTGSIGTATGTDNCGAPTITNDAPSSFPIGITTVTWTSTDASANFVTCTQEVTVVDNEPPTINCPAPITLSTDAGQCTSTGAIGTATGTDNCGAPTITNDAPTSFPIGITTVTWTSTDALGNFVTCTQEVTVEDNEPPTINCPAPISVIGDNNCEFVLQDYTSLVSTSDNCAVNMVITQSPIAGTVINGIGTHDITLSTTDLAGNVESCILQISIVDTISPTVTCLTDQTELLDGNCEFVLPDYSALTIASDNCNTILTTTQSPEVGTLYNDKQNIPVTVTFSDMSGNSTSCTFNVDLLIDPVNSGCVGEPIIPTLLTPNGDGKNDTWVITELNYIKDCTVMVFNRWGQKVFETTSYNNDWSGTSNGQDLPDGAYYYLITCNNETSYKGVLTILRTK